MLNAGNGSRRLATAAAPGQRAAGVPTPAAAPDDSAISPFPGRPLPMGAVPTGSGTNFSVVADGGEGVELCLVDAVGGERRVAMTERSHGIWHTFVPGVRVGQRYGYRVAAHDPAKLLLDPYARRVDSTDYDPAAASTPGTDTAGRAPLGIVAAPPRFGSGRPDVPWEHTVIYEAHVRGMTMRHPDVPKHLRGSYLGLAQPAIIDHLRALRVTALELLPVHAHCAEPGLVTTGRSNYWGYSTLSYFAPHPGYASRPGHELTEFVTMVDALHDAGIEVILDVVFNHTCEGGPSASAALSLLGLSPATYYLPDGEDLTGTGRTTNTGSPTTIRLVTDSLRYWADDLGVDGFRFDLAPVLGRPGGSTFDPQSALLTAIAVDPVLSERKLIAEPWDATADGYAVGRFGPFWAEWNDHFRGTVRDFWRGAGGVRDLGYRLSGSSDLYAERGPWASVNFVTAHDGFTLRDLVSYSSKHNEANQEGNRDGTDDNRSSGYGAEGPTPDPGIRAVRTRQARNLAATLLLSTGTPMLTMGDEIWRTLDGNNNAYCQDEINWLDWGPALSDPESDAAQILSFLRRTLDIRSEAPALHQGEFFEGRAPAAGDGFPDLVWFAPTGLEMTDADWFDGGRQTLQMWIDGRDVRGHGPSGAPLTDNTWLLVLHAGPHDAEITLPGPPYAEAYTPVLDTTGPTGEPADPSPLSAAVELTIPGRTLWLLRAHRTSDDG